MKTIFGLASFITGLAMLGVSALAIETNSPTIACYDDTDPPPGKANYTCPLIDDQIKGDPTPVSPPFHGKSDPAIRSDPGFNGTTNKTIWLSYSVPEIPQSGPKAPVISIHMSRSTDAGRTFSVYESTHVSHGVLYPPMIENGVNDHSAGLGGGKDHSQTLFSIRNEIPGFTFGQGQTAPTSEVYSTHVNYWVPVGSMEQAPDSHYLVLIQSFTGIDGLSAKYLAGQKLNQGSGRTAHVAYLAGALVANEPAGCSGAACDVSRTCTENCNVRLNDPAFNAPWIYQNWTGTIDGDLHQSGSPVVIHLDRVPFLYGSPINGFSAVDLANCKKFYEPTILDDVDNLYNFTDGGSKGHAYLYVVARCQSLPPNQPKNPILVFRVDPVDIADPGNWRFVGPLGGNKEFRTFLHYDGVNSSEIAFDAPEVAIGVHGDPLFIPIGQFIGRDDGGKGKPYMATGWPCMIFVAPLDKRVSHPGDAGPGMFFDASGNVTYSGGVLDVRGVIETPELMPPDPGAPVGGPSFGYEAPQLPKDADLDWDNAANGTNAACAYDRNATGGSVKDRIGVSGVIQDYQYFHKNPGGTHVSMHNSGLRP